MIAGNALLYVLSLSHMNLTSIYQNYSLKSDIKVMKIILSLNL